MEMLVKRYTCITPGPNFTKPVEGISEEFTLTVTHAPGSNSVNIVNNGEFGPHVLVEKLSWYRNWGVKTIDDLIDHLYYRP